ncbi:hypothetical protein AGABI1DRAFT_78639 [Agaricus bisporus var. burnettii JB137-S8]|uniref:HhH-GPD domain-containing protein n=1 Tax=Agaricus bisporus var. burnettii (strain JB137-S8 / ATCC MYA-4627 / FGSC 10392) TaxID=597362 RepID=K5X077_AGABU|nr:uncharacterized protein AGABI1DRAFT_78639 [Agaricus bisporus var. burnettii JB137-S8]EKM76513.1 hypothetical protein AGABI1DRAFT_78639 [Agaricus bisporus var. burnettii JB137-S8]
MLSPYFSPPKKSSKFFEQTTTHEVQNQSSTESPEENHQTISPLDDRVPSTEPLFLLYFCRFAYLYQQLARLKPTLIQESVAYDPWKLLVAVTLLNKTTGKVAIPVFWRLLEKWETPLALSNADLEELRNHIRALGTHNIRSKRLIEMSRVYHYDPPVEYDLRPSRPVVSPTKRSRKGGTRSRRLAEKYPPTAISHLPGAGTYALDSYRIFCLSHQDPLCEEWTTVLPTDKELVLFLKWKWAYQQRKIWSPISGNVTKADIPLLECLVRELSEYHTRRTSTCPSK